jgi:hypothetical protein
MFNKDQRYGNSELGAGNIMLWKIGIISIFKKYYNLESSYDLISSFLVVCPLLSSVSS